jgi:hypothetical protein
MRARAHFERNILIQVECLRLWLMEDMVYAGLLFFLVRQAVGKPTYYWLFQED